MIDAQDLCRVYDGPRGALCAVDQVTFSISSGERVALLGRSGSGKSTLLHLLAGIDRPTSGNLTVDGHSVGSLSRKALSRYRALTIGTVFQSFHLVPTLSAVQNVELPLTFQGVPRAERLRQSNEALSAVGLSARADHRPSQLSGGEQQRVGIARAIASTPSILLADEPTGNLDSQTAQEIVTLLEQLAEERQLTMVVVTHDESLAERIASRIFRMSDGRIEEAT